MRPALLYLAILTAMWPAVFGMLMVARELLHGGYWVPAAFGTGSATIRTPKTIVPIAARAARRRRAGRIGPPPLQVLHKAAPPADECEAGGA